MKATGAVMKATRPTRVFISQIDLMKNVYFCCRKACFFLPSENKSNEFKII